MCHNEWNKRVLLLFLAIFVGCSYAVMSQQKSQIKIGFLGNSILYFNDCPRLLEQMLQTKYSTVYQDSCLRPYVSLSGLWEKGNGMQKVFGNHPNAEQGDGRPADIGSPTVQDLLSRLQRKSHETRDYVILNDHSQYPARPETCTETQTALRQHYGPMFSSLKSIIPVFLQTCAYRKHVNNSDDLGSVKEFTRKVKEGYLEYVKTLEEAVPNILLAPVGDAFLFLHEQNKDLWSKLFDEDNFHPSPHGTWLQACVLYCTIVQEPPPSYQSKWFSKSRHMQHPEKLFISSQEAEELRLVACKVCDIPKAQ